MREQLIQYVDLLFAGAADCEDIKQEILQNTLDRYDDLIAEGKVPEAAYRLAITGIGDINEILGTQPQSASVHRTESEDAEEKDTPAKKLMRAIAVGLYILCPLPLIGLGDMGMDTLGLCGTLAIVAVATVLIILGGKKERREDTREKADTPKSQLGKSISSLIWAIGLALYFIVSFTTKAWHLTWVIFPILGALDSLLNTLIKNREAVTSEVSFPSGANLHKQVNRIIWCIGLATYFIISAATHAWWCTWLIFPITGAVQGLVRAILDYKEAMEYEA